MGDKEESDSDLEVLDPGILRASYFRQQLRLIYELDQCGKGIPKHWPDFEAFIDENIEWQPSPYLVHSTWLKLTCAEKEVEQNKPVDVVEISDDESSTPNSVVAKKKPKSKNIMKSQKYRPCEKNILTDVVVLGADTPSISIGADNSKTPLNKKKKRKSRSIEETNSSINDSPQKTLLKKQKKRSPTKMTEDEANALREQLLIDKIIELELPKVIKSIMSENTVDEKDLPKVVKNVIKKTRRMRKRI